MKTAIRFRIALCCLTVAINACVAMAAPLDVRLRSITERIQSVTFRSESLDRKKTFCVVLPNDYDRAKGDWPVLFLLHGRGRNERSLIDDQKSRLSLLTAPFVVVLPSGDDGWYIDSPKRKQDRYRAHFDEVVEVATEQYALSRRRESRGLSGWSMGGYGCALLAENRAGEFAAAAPIIGLLDFPRRGLPRGQSYPVPVDRFGDDPREWAQLNPSRGVERLRNTAILIITADKALDRTMNENFSNQLKDRGIQHEYRLLQGGHTFEVVRQSLPLVIQFMDRSLKRLNSDQ